VGKKNLLWGSQQGIKGNFLVKLGFKPSGEKGGLGSCGGKILTNILG